MIASKHQKQPLVMLLCVVCKATLKVTVLIEVAGMGVWPERGCFDLISA